MDQLKPLGRRDIFGILLPGTILVFIGAYVLFGVLVLLRLPVKDLLEQEFLLAAILFVTAYLVGSLLRLYAADAVDNESRERFRKAWRKKNMSYPTQEQEFENLKAKLAKGSDVSDVPDGFDVWLLRADKFPYHAWMNRMWRSHGFREVLSFFQDNYKTSMWSENITSRKAFFNYCKLVIIGGGGALAEEVNMAESLTRFFAGTVTALRLSTWLLGVALIGQLLLVAALIFAPRWGIKLILAGWEFQGFYFVFSLALIFVLQWMGRQIVNRFWRVREKEVGTVYHAFYLHSVSHPDVTAKRDQAVSRRTLKERLKNLFID